MVRPSGYLAGRILARKSIGLIIGRGDLAVLPKKGRLSEEEKAVESSDEFVRARRKHPAVESGINALENHGLDRCLDHGLRGFERYAGLAVVARNIQILGTILWKRENEKLQREQVRLRKAS